MRRKIEERLLQWSQSPRRKPLVLNGARQVGKTYSLLAFGREHYDSTLHIDFSAQPAYRSVFDGDITPHALIPQLEALARTQISSEGTLLVFDEIQMCPRALTSLKYFCEQAPEYHVVGAGSLLGVTLARGEQSFPVGKVNMLDMFPLDFEEFMWALGEDTLANLIPEAWERREPLPVHERAMEVYRTYLLVGGMPEAVQEYVNQHSMEVVREVHDSLLNGYVADMTKYAGALDSARILGVWDAVPRQLAKENHKFQYTTIESSARAHKYEAAITWLLAAGMLMACYRVDAGIHPLREHAERDFFKLYLNDCGLLSRRLGVDEAVLTSIDRESAHVRGVLAENYVAQQLRSMGAEFFYWGIASKSEVDFVVESRDGAVPIEVKSGDNVSARSLSAYRQKFHPARCVRISAKSAGEHEGMLSLPLYAVHCLGQELGI